MEVHYYLTVFPMEALIASGLEPRQFGAYMAAGPKKGSCEQIIFTEIGPGFGDHFDWEYAQRRCKPRSDGTPKHSVYLSIYRVMEFVPLDKLHSLYLTTQDGRTLELQQEPYQPPSEGGDFYIYKELCPITPIVISTLEPASFAASMTNPASKTYIPTIVFADLKMIDLEDLENTGNIGGMFIEKIDHIRECMQDIMDKKEKTNKIIDRSHLESFTYQIIREGIYIGRGKNLSFYRMKSLEELKKYHRDWARSAMIL
jgi:hypothetical protein